jgi:hypothetical protein
MSSRDTSTGRVLEEMVVPALQRAGYAFKAQQAVPDPFLPGRTHRLDVAVTDSNTGARIGIEFKWQQVSGTAEEKVPMEYLRLLKCVEHGHLDRAYIVLEGQGWSYADSFKSPQCRREFASWATEHVAVVGLAELVARLNARAL